MSIAESSPRWLVVREVSSRPPPPGSPAMPAHQLVAVPVGRALHGDQQLSGRTPCGERMQIGHAGGAVRQVGHDEAMLGAQPGDPCEQRRGAAERYGGDATSAVGGGECIDLAGARHSRISGSAGERAREQAGPQ